MAKKKNVDLFGEEKSVAPQSEFEAMLNATGVQPRGLAAGDRFRGEVLAVTGQAAFVSTGTPVDAVLPFTLSAGVGRPKSGDMGGVPVGGAREGEWKAAIET